MIGAPLVQTKLILHGKGLGEINYLLIKLHFQARDTSACGAQVFQLFFRESVRKISLKIWFWLKNDSEYKLAILNEYSYCRYMSRTHYEVLGLKSNASQEDVKSAYKQMCKKV